MALLSQAYPSAFWLQFNDNDGHPLANGYLKTFLASDHSQPIQTYTYPGSGVKNATTISLDEGGRCTMALETDKAYYVELYDSNDALQGTWDNVTSGGGEGSGSSYQFVSTDNSITITQNGNIINLTITAVENTYGTFTSTVRDADKNIDWQTRVDGNINISQSNDLLLRHGQLYHATLRLKLAIGTLGTDFETCAVTDSTGERYTFTVDESVHEWESEISWDVKAPYAAYKIGLDLPSNIELTSATLFIHGVNAVGGGGGGGSGDQADWTETDTESPAYIKHKPDLSVYALKTEIPDVPDIPTPTAQQAGNILSVDNQGNPTWTEPQTYSQEQADWAQNDSTAVDYIKNKPSIPAAQVNSDWDANSGVAQILNKPDLSVYALKSEIPTVPTIGYTEL